MPLFLIAQRGGELGEVVTPNCHRIVDPHVWPVERGHRRPVADASGSQRITTDHKVCPKLHHPVSHRLIRATETSHVLGVGKQVEGLVGERNARLEGTLQVGLLVHFLVTIKLARIIERVEERVVRIVLVVHIQSQQDRKLVVQSASNLKIGKVSFKNFMLVVKPNGVYYKVYEVLL